MDAQGTFKLIDRSSFVLNLLTGNQGEEERLARAKLLNPENVFHKYKMDIAEMIEVSKQLF